MLVLISLYEGLFMMANNAMQEFCKLFHQDCDLYGPTWADMIAAVTKMMGKEKTRELHAYLGELLNSGMGDDELADLWDRSRAEVGFGDDANHRSFLALAYEMTSD
jgi:hypothetical protein